MRSRSGWHLEGHPAVLILGLLAAACEQPTQARTQPAEEEAPPPAHHLELPEGEPALPVCDQSQAPLLTADLTPSRSIDYWELRSVLWYSGASDAWSSLTSTSGTPCGAATQPDSCQDALADLAVAVQDELVVQDLPSMCRPVCRTRALLFSAGDEVGYVDATNVTDLLVPIDTPTEAVLLLAMRSRFTALSACEDMRWADGRYLLVGADMIQDCPIVWEYAIVAVTTAGDIEVLQTEIGPETGACV